MSAAFEEYAKHAREHAASILNAAADDAKAEGVQCETVQVIQDHPYKAIVAAAKDNGCDLIVMASHGRGGIAAIVLGSVSQRIQMVLLRESGMVQPAIAAAMGVSLSTVNRAHMAYDQGGIKALKPKPNGGRKHENMTLAEEKALLARFAKAAGAGEMLNIHDLKAAYENAIGHATSDSTVYNLLHRHGWRKLMPRPFHPKRDLAAQNAFKKTAFLML